jgi:predicted alpha/beta superfamily hydrolase
MNRLFPICLVILIYFAPALENPLMAQVPAKKKAPSASPQIFPLGIIEELNSTILSEKRVLNIYLPEGYQSADSARYPVIYLLDGGADEDFIHIAGLVQFSSFEWVNRVPKSIMVGIANTDRKRDFTEGSARFMDFIEKELQPYILSRFRTTQASTLIGQSLGGLVATEILFTRPALFNRYVIVSPSLWWNKGALLDAPTTVLEQYRDRPLKIYLAVGKEGLTPGEPPRVMEVDANLLAEKLQHIKPTRWAFLFDYLPAENHGTILHQAVNNAFIFFSSEK